MIEYLPWYHPGSDLLRCMMCGALVIEGDTDTHTAWHGSLLQLSVSTVEAIEAVAALPLGIKRGKKR